MHIEGVRLTCDNREYDTVVVQDRKEPVCKQVPFDHDEERDELVVTACGQREQIQCGLHFAIPNGDIIGAKGFLTTHGASFWRPEGDSHGPSNRKSEALGIVVLVHGAHPEDLQEKIWRN